MSQLHPSVTPARWPVAPAPTFADWRPRSATPKPVVEVAKPKAKA